MVGFEALLITIEMVVFAFAHIKAFSYLPYRPAGSDASERKAFQTNRWKAFCNVIDYRDVGREVNEGTLYMAQKVTGKADLDRRDDLEVAFGIERLEKDLKEKKSRGSSKEEMAEIEKELQRVKLLGEQQGRTSFASSDRKGLLSDSPRVSRDLDSSARMLDESDDIRYPSSIAYDSLYPDPYDQYGSPILTSTPRQKAQSYGQYSALGLEEDELDEKPVPSAEDDRQPHSRKEGVAPGKRRPKKSERTWWNSMRNKKAPVPAPELQDAQLRASDLWLGSVPSTGSSIAEPKPTRAQTAPVKPVMARYPFAETQSHPRKLVMPTPLSPSRYPHPPAPFEPALLTRGPSLATRQSSYVSARRLSLDGRYPLPEQPRPTRQLTAPEMLQTRSAPLTYPAVSFASSSRSIKIVPSRPAPGRTSTSSSQRESPLTDFGAWQQARPSMPKRDSKFVFETC